MAAKQLAEKILSITKGPKSVGPFPSGTSRLPIEMLTVFNKWSRLPSHSNVKNSLFEMRFHPVRTLALGPLKDSPHDVPTETLALINEADAEFRALASFDPFASVVKENPFFTQNAIHPAKESDASIEFEWEKIEQASPDKYLVGLIKETHQTITEALTILENDHRLPKFALEAETIAAHIYENDLKPLLPAADFFADAAADYEYVNFYHENIGDLSAAEVLAREPKLARYIQSEMDNNQWYVESIDGEDEM